MIMDRGCNLECLKGKGGDRNQENAIEFVGPVKIVLVDQPRSVYLKKIWAAAFISLAQMMMGACTVLVLCYSLTYPRHAYLIALHIFLCTIGYQLCMPSAILSLNPFNGFAAPMKKSDRKFEHIFLQTFGMILSLAGSCLPFFGGNFLKLTLHFIFGLTAGSIGLFNGILGLIVLPLSDQDHIFCKCLKTFHSVIGISSFIASSACFMTGILEPRVISWLPLPEMMIFLLIFCVFYTTVIVCRPLKKFLKRII